MAGILGAVVFLAQIVLPMLVMFAVMMPTMLGGEVSLTDVTQAALWRDEVWWVEQTAKLDWRDREKSESTLALRRARFADLGDAGPPIPLDAAPSEAIPALLAVGDRLWLIGAEAVRYYENGSLSPFRGPGRPAGASNPFAYRGRPMVLTLAPSRLWTLDVAEGTQAEWTVRELTLDLPEDAGTLRALQAVEAGGRLYLFAQLHTEAPDQCSLRYRELDGSSWQVAEDTCGGSWTPVALEGRPAVVLSEEEKGRSSGVALLTLAADGPRREAIALEGGSGAWRRWGAFPRGGKIVLLSQGMPGSLRLAEVARGQVVHSARKKGSFPFGPNMMLLMTVPQLLPILLSLVLAFVLTNAMRRHRVQEYVIGGERRKFATLWQRAMAQLVDIVPIVAGFLVPTAAMWRMFSDPELMIEESGPAFPFLFFGAFLAAFVWALLVLVAYSYFEGRSGRTPGKRLLGIRVLGTDLRPCGFGRALLRNVLTFVDGFFNFQVGALLVALTENWQRLGDLAARTVVVADEKRSLTS